MSKRFANIKTPLTEIYSPSRANNTNIIRGATLIHNNPGKLHVRFSEILTYLWQLTYASNVAEYSEQTCSFDCALIGPFVRQFLTRLSAPRALCVILSYFTPLQRFIISYYSTEYPICQYFFKNFWSFFRSNNSVNFKRSTEPFLQVFSNAITYMLCAIFHI